MTTASLISCSRESIAPEPLRILLELACVAAFLVHPHVPQCIDAHQIISSALKPLLELANPISHDRGVGDDLRFERAKVVPPWDTARSGECVTWRVSQDSTSPINLDRRQCVRACGEGSFPERCCASVKGLKMILQNGTTVAVVDGRRLRLFLNKGHETRPELSEMISHNIDGHNAGSGARHRNSAANPDRSRLQEDDFAAAVAAALNSKMQDGTIEKLFLIADPRTLGEIRRNIERTHTPKLVGSIAKDLSERDLATIAQAIANQ